MESSRPTKKRKTQVRFNEDDDDALLKEAKMARSAAASGIDEEHTERDDLLADVLELFDDAETVEEEKKQAKEAKQRDDERADAMRDEAMTGMKGRTSKHDKFAELMAHVEERDEFARTVELKKR
ncbi:hypothetical protein GN244_ATG10490 [Phytophthora infestans]|uniref:Uncharacterized protein n=1 Tax=Phytophthora infestans TaxID=4787 RepID=A0A833WCQ7_PHYIN|nr:hypothetical protein GN244_ATG10490 [Phytophthora infestans]